MGDDPCYRANHHKMSAFSHGDARLLPLEGKRIGNTNTARIPEEYLQLLLPNANVHYWQQGQVYVLSQHMILGVYSLWIHDVVADGAQDILPFVPHPLYTLHYMFESGLDVRFPDSEPFRLEEDTCNLFYLEPGVSRLPLEEDLKALSVLINILPEHISALTADFPDLNKRLQQHRSGNQVINKQPFTVTTVNRMLISKILTCRYLRDDAAVFLERCCTDLFRIFCRQYNVAMVVPPAENDNYNKVFEYMRTYPHVRCDLRYFSRMFHIPEHEIEAGFLSYFAISIHDCSHMLKMMTAFDLIIQHGQSFGDIAIRVGMEAEKMIHAIEAYYNIKVAAQRN